MRVTLDAEGQVHVEPAVFTPNQWEQFLFDVNSYRYEYARLLRDASPLTLASTLSCSFV